MEREVLKMIHYRSSSGEVEWSSGVVELSSRKVEWSSGVVEWSRAKVEWSSGVVG